jgi:hypothetical protein
MPVNKDTSKSFYIVWIVISVSTFLILLIPFIAEKDFILSNTPDCIIKKTTGANCVSCGMTKAFVDISEGNLRSASVHNKFSPFVYSVFILNFIFFVSYSIKKFLINKKN